MSHLRSILLLNIFLHCELTNYQSIMPDNNSRKNMVTLLLNHMSAELDLRGIF